MDTVSITAVVTLLASFVKMVAGRTVEQVAEDVGDDIADRLHRLYRTVKSRFSSNSFAEGALQRFEAEPDNDRRRTTLEDAIAEIADADPKFAEMLEQLLNDVRGADPIQAQGVIIESGAVALQGEVRQIGRYVAGRDMKINSSDTT